MSVTPSIFVRSLRTEAAQPPHVIFGTLRDTSTPSAAFEATGATVGVCETSAETGSVSAAQPAMDAMTPAVINIGTNFFTVILQKIPTTQKMVVRDHHSRAYLHDDSLDQPDTQKTPSASLASQAEVIPRILRSCSGAGQRKLLKLLRRAAD